jgi:Ca2+-binding RTX toxin-like protein
VETSSGKACSLQPEVCVMVDVLYAAAPGEANDVEVSSDGGAMVIRDKGATITPGYGCTSQGPNRVRCLPPEGPSTGIRFIEANLGDNADRLDQLSTWITRADGEGGNDHISGGPSHDRLIGGVGSDALDGRDGSDEFRDPTGVEADAVQGGLGQDWFSYIGRTKPVTVDLVSPDRPSGEAGENDSLASIEIALGGSGADVMRAGVEAATFSGRGGNDQLFGGFGRDALFGNNGNDRVFGSHGKDRLEGGKDKDRLDGGCDADKIYGNSGNDRLIGLDGYPDRLHGGGGVDFAHRDQLDDLAQIERRRFTHIDGCAL